jgi:hypothetical protein
MSNPIADTAKYFAEKGNNPQPNLRIFPSQDPQSSPHDLLSPESPESRRRPHIPSHNLSDFDPKLQWQKVLKRLPNKHKSTQEESDSSDDAQSTGEESSFRMRRRQRKQPYYDDEDDFLPDINDLYKQEETDQSDIILQPEPTLPLPQSEQQKPENYFVNPFKSDSTGISSDGTSKTTAETILEHVPAPSSSKKLQKKKNKQTKEGADHEHMVSSDGSSDNDNDRTPTATSTTEGKGRAKKHWGKTLDKVRLIANLHTLPHQTKATVISTCSLAPYYPPLFDPVFIALSKDQHGHPWVSLHAALYL